MKLLKELCEVPGIPGREKPVIDIMERELSRSVDQVDIDNMGNVIGIKKGSTNFSIMLAGHMDEIGFIVSHIDKNGFIRFAPRGGHIPRVLISQRVLIYGKETLTGIVEGAPPFLAKAADRMSVPALKDMFIDTGLTEKELKGKIEIGDPIVLDRKFISQGDVFISKAFDNRIACYIILEVMKKIKSPKATIFAVGTTQEEVGLRGAYSAAKDLDPDIGIAIDITGAFDTPGVPEHSQVTKLGKGVAIKINDSSSISNHGIVKFMAELAKKNKIKFQYEILPFGGTDAAAMQRFGKGPVCTLSIPTRYAHSPNEMINKKDIKAAIDLLVKFLQNYEDCKIEF